MQGRFLLFDRFCRTRILSILYARKPSDIQRETGRALYEASSNASASAEHSRECVCGGLYLLSLCCVVHRTCTLDW